MTKLRYCSIVLLFICVILFILQNTVNGFTDFLSLNKNALSEFQIWRFLTAIFLHGNILHLMYNMFALILFGFILENKIGSKNFIMMFLASGIIANLIAVNFYESSLGASGAIYGAIGCLTIINPFMGVWAFGLIMPMFIAAILWIIGDLLGVFGFGEPGIGNIAHLSGIVIGLVFGIAFRILNREAFKRKTQEKVLIPNDYVNAWEKKYMK